MGVLDLETLLSEVSSEAPCGENLEYDAAFVELEGELQGKPERQFGDTVIPAEEPNWGEVRRGALELLGRTKDLRVALHLSRALLRTDGFEGFADGLELLLGLLDRYWDAVHPQLDPEDDNDPTLRVNTIVSLCDPETVLRAVRETPLVSSAVLGRYSLRDVQLATGALTAPAGVIPPELGAVEAAFLGCDLDPLQGTFEAVRRSLAAVSAVEKLLTERVGVSRAADLSPIAEVLEAARQVLDERLARRGDAAPEAPAGESPVQGSEGTVAPGAGPQSGARAVSGDVNSRDDVLRVLDRVCDYFRRNEPSSPVPMLLRRAQRLVSKSFLEIVRDLAPDGLSQVEMIRGAESEDDAEG